MNLARKSVSLGDEDGTAIQYLSFRDVWRFITQRIKNRIKRRNNEILKLLCTFQFALTFHHIVQCRFKVCSNCFYFCPEVQFRKKLFNLWLILSDIALKKYFVIRHLQEQTA